MTEHFFGLSKAVVLAIQGVFVSHPEVEEVILYGSRAKGNYKVGSDIDLTMKGEAVDFALLSTVSYELYELPIPYSVDLSIFSNISNEALVEHIERAGKVFYTKELV